MRDSAVVRAICLVGFPDSYPVKVRRAELADELVPRESSDILDGWIGFAELLDVDIQVPVVQQSYELVVYGSFKIDYAKTISRPRHLYLYLDNIVVPMTGGIGTFSEDLEVLLLGKALIPKLVHRGKFKLLTEINHFRIP